MTWEVKLKYRTILTRATKTVRVEAMTSEWAGLRARSDLLRTDPHIKEAKIVSIRFLGPHR